MGGQHMTARRRSPVNATLRYNGALKDKTNLKYYLLYTKQGIYVHTRGTYQAGHILYITRYILTYYVTKSKTDLNDRKCSCSFCEKVLSEKSQSNT